MATAEELCTAARKPTASSSPVNKIFDLPRNSLAMDSTTPRRRPCRGGHQTAHLKAHYPVEFLSALCTNDMGDTSKLTVLVNEAKAMGIDVLPPDINESQGTCLRETAP